MTAAPDHALSPLDEAHARRLKEDEEGALRIGVTLLEATLDDLGAALLIARVLVDNQRTTIAGEIAGRLVDGFIRRGDLPSAVVAAFVAVDAGEDVVPFHARIAQAFGKGSPRIGDVSPTPPPLPKAATMNPIVAKLKGEALIARAEQALGKLLNSEDKVPADSKVPDLPLFGSLDPENLTRLLGSFGLTELAAGDEAVHQGDEGRQAFIVARGLLRVVRSTEEGVETTLAALGPGAIFGEMALVSDAPRAASVAALEPAQLLVVSRDDLEALAEDMPAIGTELGNFCRARMVANLLRHSMILKAVEPKWRDDLMSRFETRVFEGGDALVKRDQESDGLYLIASGRVQVQSPDADGDTLVLAELGPGDVVGEISLVLRRPATADVVAIHPTVAMHLGRAQFHMAIRQHPTLLNELYELATKREEETRSVVGQAAVDVGDIVLV